MIGLTKSERERLLADGLMRAPQQIEAFNRAHTPKIFGPDRVTPRVRETQNTPPANATWLDGKWISNKWLAQHAQNSNNNLVKNTKT